MKKIISNILLIFSLVFAKSFVLSAQNTDSLIQVWKNKSLPDTSRLKALDALAWDVFLYDIPDSAIFYASEQLTLAKKINHRLQQANALNTRGVAYFILGKFENATTDFNACLIIQNEIGEKSSVASTLNNLGVVCTHQGNNAKAIEYYTLSLKQREQIKDEIGVAACLGNIGLLYDDMGDTNIALNYYKRALLIEEKINDEQGIATNLSNIANIYAKQKKYKQAFDAFNRSDSIYRKLNDKRGLSTVHNNIGTIYKEQGNYAKALPYYLSGLKLREEMGFQQGIAASSTSLGTLYFLLNDYNNAIKYLTKSVGIAREINSLMDLRDASAMLYEVYKKINKHQDALKTYEVYIATRDSISSEENQKEIIRQEYKYSYEKMALADSIKNAQIQQLKDAEIKEQKAYAEKQEAELNNKRLQQYILFGGLILVIIFSGFIYNRFKLTQRQRDIIDKQKSEVEKQKEYAEEQRHLVEEKNKEIMDSIVYAKRIQTAILPPARIVKEYLPDSFILYKPKDIVAGDFYWMESFAKASDSKGIVIDEMESETPNKMVASTDSATILFAAADCTGHGVPGALVSVVCHNALNRSVKEFGLYNPAEILNKTREIVISEFEKSDDEVKDGMDISLCSLNISNQKLEWAGANNPLWIIRDGQILEYKADKQPIGKYAEAKSFYNHSIDLLIGDAIYIFTDGYQDQFGGENLPEGRIGGKKFKASALKELLISIQNKNMSDQKQILDTTFEKWRGELEQVDDVCIIGVKLT